MKFDFPGFSRPWEEAIRNAPGSVVARNFVMAQSSIIGQAGCTAMIEPPAKIVHVVHHVEKPPKTNCGNCGAPRERHSPDCSYCGTEDAF